MDNFDDNDEMLFCLYLKLNRFLAGYAVDCAIVEDAESGVPDSENIQAARLRRQNAAAEWRLALKQMIQLVPRTKRGSLAMNRVLQLCFKHHLAEDVDVMELAKSHILHLDKFLDEGDELVLSKPSLDSSQVDVTSDQN